MMTLTFVKENAIEELPRMLAFNYAELKQGLTEYLTKFNGLIVSEDGIKDAESDRANINKTRDAIKRARINIKSQTFDEFENKAKELEGMCDRASESIASQLREFEDMRRAKKLELVKDAMKRVVEASTADVRIRESLYWANFLQENWTRKRGAWSNAGYDIEGIEIEISDAVKRIVSDYESLSLLTENETLEVRTVSDGRYFKDFDLKKTVEFVKDFKNQQRAIADARAKAEEVAKARSEAEARNKPQEASQEQATTVATSEIAKPVAATELVAVQKPDTGSGAKTYTFRIEVSGTLDALKKLKEYGISTGIFFKNIAN
jgi:hypothetical protein